MTMNLETSIELGVSARNPLLLDYCDQLLVAEGIATPPTLSDARGNLAHAAAEGSVLRWLDTDLTDNDARQSRSVLLTGKIERVSRQIQRLQAGAGFMCYVFTPALNEEKTIGGLVESVRRQPSETPIVFVVADNNCTDSTARIVQGKGGNVVPAPKPGVGAARQTAIDRILATATTDLCRTLLLQTDADCLAEPGYAQAAVDAFAANPQLQIGVGPSTYAITQEDGTTTTLTSGKDHAAFLGTKGLRAYFESIGRDPADYLLEAPYRYLVGPNTSFRASLLATSGLRYPEDGRWETLDLSIRVQQRLPSSKAIGYITGQRITASGRAITGDRSFLTAERLAQIKNDGFVGMYKSNGVTCTPEASIRQIVTEIDAATYGLQNNEIVKGIVDEQTVTPGPWRTMPAVHAATGAPILHKIAVIVRA